MPHTSLSTLDSHTDSKTATCSSPTDLLHFMVTHSVLSSLTISPIFSTCPPTAAAPFSFSPGFSFPSLSSLQTTLPTPKHQWSLQYQCCPAYHRWCLVDCYHLAPRFNLVSLIHFVCCLYLYPLHPAHISVWCPPMYLHPSFHLWCPTLAPSMQFCPRWNFPSYQSRASMETWRSGQRFGTLLAY